MITFFFIAPAFAYLCSPQKKFDLGGDQFRSAIKFTANSVAIQANSQILFVNQELTEIYDRVEYKSDLQCQSLIAYETWQYLLSICFENNKTPHVQAFKCGGGCVKHGDPVQIQNVDIFNKAKVAGNTLLVLSTDNFGTSSTLFFHTMKFTETGLSLEPSGKQIDYKFFGSPTKMIFNDFDIKFYIIDGAIAYKLIILDRKYGIRYIDCTLQNSLLSTGLYGGFDLRYAIPFKTTTYLQRTGFAGDYMIVGNKITMSILITTNDLDNYVIKVVFQGLAQPQMTLQSTLKRYGTYSLIEADVLTLDGKYASIPYTSKALDVYSLQKISGVSIVDLQTNNNLYQVNSIVQWNNVSYLIYSYSPDSLIICKVDN